MFFISFDSTQTIPIFVHKTTQERQ